MLFLAGKVGDGGGDIEENEDARDDCPSESSIALWRCWMACLIEFIKASTPKEVFGVSFGLSESYSAFPGRVPDLSGESENMWGDMDRWGE